MSRAFDLGPLESLPHEARMSQPASFTLAKALRDVDKFKPLTEQEHDELVALLMAWMDRVRIRRGDVTESQGQGSLLDD
jgi:hypothetical protein